MRQVGMLLAISHSTVLKCKNRKYTKSIINVQTKYAVLIAYLVKYDDSKNKSIEVCLYNFKRYHEAEAIVTVQQVYSG